MLRVLYMASIVAITLAGALGSVIDLPAAITGTYNVSFLMGAAPKSFVQSVSHLLLQA
jgi:hypothetical protein